MLRDKYSALWVSYSSISDYLKCPRSYYLKNIYKNPKTHKKIQIIQPALTLGQVIHEVIERLSILPLEQRLKQPLKKIYNELFAEYKGTRGGFKNNDEETEYYQRGIKMIERMQTNPGPLAQPAIKIRQNLPNIWLTDTENIILCGKIDWLEYFSETDQIGILDFKTGKNDEDPQSLQLYIYYLLVKNLQKRSIKCVSYWYLDRDDQPMETSLPDFDTAKKDIMEISKKIELAKKLEHFSCKNKDGCFACLPYEQVLLGKAQKIGVNNYNQEIYIL